MIEKADTRSAFLCKPQPGITHNIMKTSTLSTLLVSKSIFNETKNLVDGNNKYTSTAAIILLQDFVELVVLAALDELDVDEKKSLESKSFDELLGELKKNDIRVIKSGTIKALNKQRVISKHYGQLTEPASVVNYFSTAVSFVDDLLMQVLGKKLNEIFLTDLLKDGVVKNTLNAAVNLGAEEKYFDALIELRKAFFIAYEYEYSVYSWRNHDEKNGSIAGLLGFGISGGLKAPFFTRNKQWIEQNIRKPLDYIQLNTDQLKIDCLEWGVNTVDIENFRRLTPEVIRTEENAWHLDYEASYIANEATNENFRYCLDLLIDFLLKKQSFDSNKKWPRRENFHPAPPIYIGKPVYASPSTSSRKLHTVEAGYYYAVDRIVTGFIDSENYLFVHLYQEIDGQQNNHVWGYLLID